MIPNFVPDGSKWLSTEEWEKRKEAGRRADRKMRERARKILAAKPDPEPPANDDQDEK